MDNDKIPALRRIDEMPPLHTQTDLYQHWRAMMGPLGFTEPLLWMLLIDHDKRCTPMVTQLDDLPDAPDDRFIEALMSVCARMVPDMVPGGSVAFLYSRPGRAGLTASDRAWASGLLAATRSAGVGSHPVHLANDEEMRVFALDDMAESA